MANKIEGVRQEIYKAIKLTIRQCDREGTGKEDQKLKVIFSYMGNSRTAQTTRDHL